MEHQTLLLNPWMSPLAIIDWQRAAFLFATGKIDALETYPEEVIRSEHLAFELPSVARLRKPITSYKKGIKFSRVNVMVRDGFRCQFCGRRLPMRHLNYDHVIPRVRGGKTAWENITTSCYPCNQRKGKRTPEEAGMRLLSQPFKPHSLPLSAPVWKVNQMPNEWRPYLESSPEWAQMLTG
jgi:5-methylcytosine-specific restriction endonuclease McrA